MRSADKRGACGVWRDLRVLARGPRTRARSRSRSVSALRASERRVHRVRRTVSHAPDETRRVCGWLARASRVRTGACECIAAACEAVLLARLETTWTTARAGFASRGPRRTRRESAGAVRARAVARTACTSA